MLLKRAICLTVLVAFFAGAAFAQMPDFKAKDVIQKKEIQLNKLKGKQVILVFFSASYDNVQVALKGLSSLQSKNKGKLQIVGIAFGKHNGGKLKSFVKKAKLSFPVVLMDKKWSEDYTSFADNMDANAMNKYILFVDKDGNFYSEAPDYDEKADTLSLAMFLGQKAPAVDFSLKNVMDGSDVSLSKFKGKVILLNFWATWCPPCVNEIPELVKLQEKYAGKFAIVGLSLDEDSAEVKKFYTANKINYPIAMGTAEIQATYGGIPSIPTTFIIDTEGNIVDKIVGGRSYEDFEAAIKPYLK